MVAQKFFHGFFTEITTIKNRREDNSDVGVWPEENSPEENDSSKVEDWPKDNSLKVGSWSEDNTGSRRYIAGIHPFAAY